MSHVAYAPRSTVPFVKSGSALVHNDARDDTRWPPLLTAAFALSTCGAFWAAVAFACLR